VKQEQNPVPKAKKASEMHTEAGSLPVIGNTKVLHAPHCLSWSRNYIRRKTPRLEMIFFLPPGSGEELKRMN